MGGQTFRGHATVCWHDLQRNSCSVPACRLDLHTLLLLILLTTLYLILRPILDANLPRRCCTSDFWMETQNKVALSVVAGNDLTPDRSTIGTLR